ncbi:MULTISPECIES: hypothetical protein [Streptomyces]|uniref:hypothetical protein n=1 Tax=Streptomyces TaxID=1883 RepID=UPI003252CCE9|nr:DUF4276 family protein [Streptomyces sp. NBC_00882]WSZ57132.1 DUF4276 family protein [Streptomyces canus]
MAGQKQAGGHRDKSVIAIAGEGQHDRDVLRQLLPVLCHWPAARRPKIIEIKKKTSLNKANYQLSPRLDKLRNQAEGQAKLLQARLAGIVVHVDLDGVIDEAYERRRTQLSTELQKTFGCDTALALVADEMEAWLMLFPDAFPKVNSTWKLTQQDRTRNLGTIPGGSKELLKSRLTRPPYLMSHAPKVIEKAVAHGYVASCDPSRNRSYADFTADLAQWK